MSDFFIARAQTLRNFHRGHDREAAIDTLRELKAQAEQVGLNVALPRIDAALEKAG